MQSTEHGPGLWAITGGRLPAGLACHAQELVSWELQCCGVRIDSASTPSPYIINATTVATQPMNPLCRVARAGIPDNEAGVCPGLLIPTIARIAWLIPHDASFSAARRGGRRISRTRSLVSCIWGPAPRIPPANPGTIAPVRGIQKMGVQMDRVAGGHGGVGNFADLAKIVP
jgi:hypothetical protein